MMEEEFGCDPADILGAIGPSICQDCYEVSEDVIEKFRENYDENLWPEIFYQKENGKYQLNLWKANESVFLEAGLLTEHYCSDQCMYTLQPGYFGFHTEQQEMNVEH